jgi:hypothetical protein
MKVLLVMCCGLLVASVAWGSDDDRSKLIGSWRMQDDAGKDTDTVWVLASKGDALHISRTEGAHKIAEFECAATGHDCNIKEAGKSAKVSLWYNGGALVELETRGSEVVKRKIGIASDGHALEVETTPIMPAGRPQKALFKRVAEQAAK